MANWQPQYPINTGAGGDTVYDGFVKVNSEYQAIYSRLNELRSVRASSSAPADANQYELWLDTSTNPPTLRYYDGANWKEVDELVGTQTPAANAVPMSLNSGVLSKGWTPFFTGFKNRIINGDFSVWQRGTSFSSTGYTADRWRYDTDTDDSVSISKTNTTGSESFTAQSYASIALTAGTTGNFNKFSTRLEFPKLYFGKTVTLSFWAKASVATNITAKIAFNFSGTEYNAVSSAASIGTTWQRHTVTFTLGTPSGFTESGSDYLDVALLLPVNTTVTIDVANVQLEEGDTVTDFEFVSYDIQLLRCMRYYEKGYTYIECPVGSTAAKITGITTRFINAKRSSPTITASDGSTSGTITRYNSTGSVVPGETNFTIDSVSRVEFRLYTASGLDVGGIGFNWTADAEL